MLHLGIGLVTRNFKYRENINKPNPLLESLLKENLLQYISRLRETIINPQASINRHKLFGPLKSYTFQDCFQHS